MFENCTTLTSFPTVNGTYADIKNIGNNAFKNCSSLTRLSTYTYGTSGKFNIESIGDSAFENCTALTSLGLNLLNNASTSLTAIGERAFAQCTSLAAKGIYLPSGVKTIKPYAFANCKTATFPAAFWNLNANNLTSIEEGAFLSCSSLSRITTSTNLTKIGKYAFEYCSTLANTPFDDLTKL